MEAAPKARSTRAVRALRAGDRAHGFVLRQQLWRGSQVINWIAEREDQLAVLRLFDPSSWKPTILDEVLSNLRRLSSRAELPPQLVRPRQVLVGPPGPAIEEPLLAGVSLRALLDHIRKGGARLELPTLVSVARQLCGALAPLHQGGTGHGAILPELIILGFDGRVHLAGYGLRGLGRAVSFRYTAPERVGRRSQPSPAADIFSLGAVLYEMAVGRQLFAGSSKEVKLELASGEPSLEVVPVAAHHLELTPVVERCLDRLAAERFADAGELLEELAQIGVDDGGRDSVSAAVAPLSDAFYAAWPELQGAQQGEELPPLGPPDEEDSVTDTGAPDELPPIAPGFESTAPASGPEPDLRMARLSEELPPTLEFREEAADNSPSDTTSLPAGTPAPGAVQARSSRSPRTELLPLDALPRPEPDPTPATATPPAATGTPPAAGPRPAPANRPAPSTPPHDQDEDEPAGWVPGDRLIAGVFISALAILLIALMLWLYGLTRTHAGSTQPGIPDARIDRSGESAGSQPTPPPSAAPSPTPETGAAAQPTPNASEEAERARDAAREREERRAREEREREDREREERAREERARADERGDEERRDDERRDEERREDARLEDGPDRGEPDADPESAVEPERAGANADGGDPEQDAELGAQGEDPAEEQSPGDPVDTGSEEPTDGVALELDPDPVATPPPVGVRSVSQAAAQARPGCSGGTVVLVEEGWRFVHLSISRDGRSAVLPAQGLECLVLPALAEGEYTFAGCAERNGRERDAGWRGPLEPGQSPPTIRIFDRPCRYRR